MIEDIFNYIVAAVKRYGWSVIFVLIGFYFAAPYIAEFQRQRSLASANSAERRKVLDEDKRRVRLNQQLKQYAARHSA